MSSTPALSDNGSDYTVCRTPSGQFQVARVRLDGTTIDTHDLSISLTDGGLEHDPRQPTPYSSGTRGRAG